MFGFFLGELGLITIIALIILAIFLFRSFRKSKKLNIFIDEMIAPESTDEIIEQKHDVTDRLKKKEKTIDETIKQATEEKEKISKEM